MKILINAPTKARIKYCAVWIGTFVTVIAIGLLATWFMARSIARHTPVHLPPAPSPAQVLHLPSPKK